MSEGDPRPPVWVGHVVLETDRIDESTRFMRPFVAWHSELRAAQ